MKIPGYVIVRGEDFVGRYSLPTNERLAYFETMGFFPRLKGEESKSSRLEKTAQGSRRKVH